MQTDCDWKECQCGSIDALVPYLVRVPAIFLLVDFVDPQDKDKGRRQ